VIQAFFTNEDSGAKSKLICTAIYEIYMSAVDNHLVLVDYERNHWRSSMEIDEGKYVDLLSNLTNKFMHLTIDEYGTFSIIKEIV
jgi:hypothetical protein